MLVMTMVGGHEEHDESTHPLWWMVAWRSGPDSRKRRCCSDNNGRGGDMRRRRYTATHRCATGRICTAAAQMCEAKAATGIWCGTGRPRASAAARRALTRTVRPSVRRRPRALLPTPSTRAGAGMLGRLVRTAAAAPVVSIVRSVPAALVAPAARTMRTTMWTVGALRALVVPSRRMARVQPAASIGPRTSMSLSGLRALSTSRSLKRRGRKRAQRQLRVILTRDVAGAQPHQRLHQYGSRVLLLLDPTAPSVLPHSRRSPSLP